MTDDIRRQRGGILENRKAAVGILLFCIYASVTTWRLATRTSRVAHHSFDVFGYHLSHDPILIFAFAWGTCICIGVSYKSAFRPDRFVFGAAGFSFALKALRAATDMSGFLLFAVRAADALAWTVAAAICAAILAGGLPAEKDQENGNVASG